MRTFLRSKVTLLFMTFAVALAIPAIALADDISNSVDTSIDAVAETMPLEEGGANGTTTLYVTPRNGDSKNGCNLTAGSSLGLSVSSSNTAVATVSPSSVTFTSCGDVKTLTVTPVSEGTATISVSQTSNNTGGTFNLAPATFTVNVAPPPNTPPQVSVTGVTGGTSYNKGSVPSATCQVTDTEDGNSSFPATLSAVTGTYASDGIGSQTASCSYTDAGGATASASETYSIADPSVPVITHNVSGTQGTNDWYTSNVSVDWTVSDPQSPNSLTTNGCDDFSVISDQGETTYTCEATSAGGTTNQSVTIKRDATKPSVTVSLAHPADHNGWYNAPVGYGVSARSDVTSGIASCQADATFSGPDSQNASVSRECTDLAGNVGSDSESFQYDNTNPTISGSRSLAANGFGWNNEAVTVSYTCDDDLSGVDGTCGPNENFPNEAAGQSSTGSVADTAGNTKSATVSPINIDLTDPVVTAGTVSGTSGLMGWYTGAVTQTFNATDALSGIAGAVSNSKTSTTEGQSVTLTSDPFSDKADNTKTGSATFKIDLSNPVLNITGAANGTTYTACGTAPTKPDFAPSDAISGLDGSQGDTWNPPATGVGTYTYTAHAKDIAGRTTSETRTYTRTYGSSAYTGLLQPINAGSTPRSTFKLGSTVPLKFLLACGSTPITNANATFSLTKVDSTVESAVNETPVDLPASTGNQFRLSDATTGQYIYNLSTKTLTQGTYNLNVDLHDGSDPRTNQVSFDVKK